MQILEIFKKLIEKFNTNNYSGWGKMGTELRVRVWSGIDGTTLYICYNDQELSESYKIRLGVST